MSSNPNASQLTENLSGAIDVMFARDSGLSRIDSSSDGFYWSFCALLIAGLLDATALSLLFDGSTNDDVRKVGKSYFVFGHLIVALIGYGASLLALYLLCRAPDEQRNFIRTVVVHNWASPIISLAFLPLILISKLAGSPSPDDPNSIMTFVSVFWLGLLIFVGLRIMRISLAISPAKAGLFFATTTLVSLIVTEGLESFLGLTLSS